MASERLTDVTTAVADIGLNAILDSGAFDGVPIFGALTGTFRAGVAIREHLFMRKVAEFLITFEATPAAKRKDFIADLERRGKKSEFGEQIIFLIERMDDMKKPVIVGRIMSAAATGNIPLTKAMRLAKIVDRAYLEDLQSLVDFKAGFPEDRAVADSLFSVGLLIGDGLQLKYSEDDSNDDGMITYRMNEYGRLLVQFGLKDQS